MQHAVCVNTYRVYLWRADAPGTTRNEFVYGFPIKFIFAPINDAFEVGISRVMSYVLKSARIQSTRAHNRQF